MTAIATSVAALKPYQALEQVATSASGSKGNREGLMLPELGTLGTPGAEGTPGR